MTSKNDILFERAQRSIPAGVNSPVRAFRSVGGTPRFFVSGSGSRASWTPTARPMSITSVPGAPWCSATPTPRWCAPCSMPPRRA